jgi:hypothetical protein
VTTVIGPDRSPFRAGFCTVSFFIGGSWVDVDLHELSEDGVTLTRDTGLASGSGASAGSCSFRMKDPTGKWSPRHPSSPYYGQIGKGTPLRVVTELIAGAPSTRFYGEVVTFQPSWGRDGSKSAVVDVTAAGTLRRIGLGASPLRSPIYRGRSTIGADLVAYWSCEDGSNATAISAYSTAKAGTFTGSPALGASSVVLGSDPLPTIEDARFAFVVPSYTSTQAQVRALLALPASGVANGTELLRVNFVGGTLGRVTITWQTGGDLSMAVLNQSDTVLSTVVGTGLLPADGKPYQLSLEVDTSGASVVSKVVTLQAGATSGIASSTTAAATTIGRAATVFVNDASATMTGSTLGHVTVEKTITSVFALDEQLVGYRGETAGARLTRLCAEAGISFALYDGADTEPMGPQHSGSIEDLLRECEASDGGFLYEPRSSTDLGYRARRSLMGQGYNAVTYVDNMLSPFAPVEDDSGTVNVATVQRDGGASATVTQSAGALGTAKIGTYEDSRTLSLATDARAALHAQWRLHLGTFDEARFPSVGWDFADPRILSDAPLVATLLNNVGLSSGLDVSAIDTALPWLPPFNVRLIIAAMTETIQPKSYRIDLTCIQGRPWETDVWGASTARYALDGTTVRTAATSGATSLAITTPDPGWTHADGDFEVVVTGEVMLVTGVSGSVPNQTLTVTRSRNGVVKAHSVGEVVDLAEPTYYSF